MVSVVIPTYGRANKISDAIQSVINQTYKNIEIIVVDDNGIGTENQYETECLINKISITNIIYIKHKVNMGGCAARNSGIKASHGEFIAFLDDDDVWSPDYLSLMLPCFQNDKIGAVYSDLYVYNGRYTCSALVSNGPSGNVYYKILEGWCPTSTSLVVVRKAAIVDCGMFDENVKSFQDYDMWLTMSKKYDFERCDRKLLLKFEGVGEQTSVNPEKRRLGFEYICQKWEPTFSEKELEFFNKFKIKQFQLQLFNSVLYNKSKKKSFFREYIKYLRLPVPHSNKRDLTKRLLLPAWIVDDYTFFRNRSTHAMIMQKGKIDKF